MFNYCPIADNAYPYDPAQDIDQYLVCSRGQVEDVPYGHSIHSDLRSAKVVQMELAVAGQLDTWIDVWKALGPPTIEEQLDAQLCIGRRALSA